MLPFYKKIYQKEIAVPKALHPSHIPVLDGLRGIAILMVLLPHIGLNVYVLQLGLFISSNTGVHIFFIISGFLITALSLKEKINKGYIDVGAFYKRRALRILPVAYLFLITLVLLEQFLPLQITKADYFASFLFYKNLPIPNEPYTAHFWTLAIEVQFYLAFPLLLRLGINRYMLLAMLVVVGVPFVCIIGALGLLPLPDIVINFCNYFFWKGPFFIMVGSAVALLWFKGLITPPKYNRCFTALVFLVAVVISNPKFVFYSKYISECLGALFIAWAVIGSISNRDYLANLLSNQVITYLGLISYSLYIWQELFIGVHGWQPWLHFLAGAQVWVIASFKLVCIFIIAIVSYRIERYFLSLKQRKPPANINSTVN